MSLRTIRADDWPLWRELRQQALAEAPYAFSSKLVDWQDAGDTEARWRSRLSAVPLNVIGYVGESPVGMVSATAPENGTIELISMWVAPAARGRGVGDALVGAVIDWAQNQGATRVALAVYDRNRHAIALYRRHRFTDRGPLDAGGAEQPCERSMIHDIVP